jgi:hypothetical protein
MQEQQQEVIVSSHDVITMNHHGCNRQSSLDALPAAAPVILLFCAWWSQLGKALNSSLIEKAEKLHGS